MKVLLTNDDGINARGLQAMKVALDDIAEVTVSAPETEMSAVGHSITITDPLRVRKVCQNGDQLGIAVNGTPADCVKIAVRAIMDEKPDLVVSGINHGQNVATNVIYSGTVSAATEGMILGIPSVAVSMASFNPVDFSVATEYAMKVIKEVAQRGLPKDTLLSVNIPDASLEEVKGIKICRLGISKFEEVFEKRVDPRQNDYFWQGGQMLFADEDSDADIVWLHNKWVTITPIHFDLTDYEFMGELDNWEFSR